MLSQPLPMLFLMILFTTGQDYMPLAPGREHSWRSARPIIGLMKESCRNIIAIKLVSSVEQD